jgi:uncharacterized protein (DUF58 family)
MHKLKTIILKTKKRIFSEFSGNNRSFLKGEGSDFEEIRAYIYGDDRRKIDWKSSAKMQSLYVRVYNEEREVNVVVASMLGGNLYFGQKHSLMVEICAILGYSAIKNSDLFSGCILSEKEKKINKPSKKTYLLEEYLKKISSYELLNLKNEYKKDVEYLKKSLKKRSLLFLISDFLDQVDLTPLSKKHEIVVIIIRDKNEENPLLQGDTTLVDPVTNETLKINITPKVIQKYRENYKKNDAKLIAHLNLLSIRHIKIYTNEDAFVKISSL